MNEYNKFKFSQVNSKVLKKTLPYKSVMTETVAGIYFCQCQSE